MDANEILEKVLKETRESRAGLAKSIGLQPHRLQDIARGKSKEFAYEVADKIASAYPQFNREWLLTGEGEMLVSGNTTTAGAGSNQVVGNNTGHISQSTASDLASTIQDLTDIIKQSQATTATAQAQTNALIAQLAESQDQITALINLLNAQNRNTPQ